MYTVKELFEKYRKTDIERTTYPTLNNWLGERGALYVNGIVIGKIKENDATTMEFLEKDILEDEILEQIRNYLLFDYKYYGEMCSKNIISDRNKRV